jgi:hypothetical protein
MNYTEIIKLLDAGYTREEILNMQQPEPEPAPEPEPTPDPEPAPDPAQAAVDKLTNLLTTIDSRIKDLQAANILQAQQPGGQDNHVKTAEEALTELIRPQLKGGNET